MFSMAMGDDYSVELISIETYAPQFIGHNKIFLGSVSSQLILSLIVMVLDFRTNSGTLKSLLQFNEILQKKRDPKARNG